MSFVRDHVDVDESVFDHENFGQILFFWGGRGGKGFRENTDQITCARTTLCCA